MRIEMSLDPSYQEAQWGLRQAFREFVANAFDGEALHGAKATVTHRRGIVTIRNEGVRLDRDVLMLGRSGSRGKDAAIGTFGEGLPMALLTMCRLAAADGSKTTCRITNDDESWVPSFEPLATFGGTVGLVITTRVCKPRGAFIVEIGGVDDETWGDLSRMFLRTDPANILEGFQILAGDGSGTVFLTDPAFAGRIYVKGVFVGIRDIGFGVDVKALELNRDREMVNEMGLRYIVTAAAVATMDADEAIEKAVVEGLAVGNSFFASYAEYALGVQNGAIDLLLRRFREAHGEIAYPCASMEEVTTVTGLGFYGVIVADALARVLQSRFTPVTKLRRDAERRVVRYLGEGDMTGSEFANWDMAESRLRAVLPADYPPVLIRAAEFPVGSPVRGIFTPAGGGVEARVVISRLVLDDLRATVVTLAHELARGLPSVESEGDSAHAQGWAELLADAFAREVLRGGW